MQHRELIDAVEAHDLVRCNARFCNISKVFANAYNKEGMMQTNGLNIALIGCGFFGVQLASAFDKAQANLIAVTDINPSLAQKLADQYCSKAFFSVEEMLAETKAGFSGYRHPKLCSLFPSYLSIKCRLSCLY